MSADRDYVLGTHDEEIERLGLQHRVWRPRAAEGWRDAGFTRGQTIVDVGCGPGWATQDLSEIVGASGRVIAIDRSRRFLDVVEARKLNNVEVHEADLDTDELPRVQADAAWVRWVFAFMKQPRELLRKVLATLKPGGTIVIHEYFDYSTWRLAPRSEIFERFVRIVMETWRADGGEPDIGLQLPAWLAEEGATVRRLRPIVEVVPRSNFIWEWPATFVATGLARLVDLGRITADEARRTAEDFAERERDGRTWIITPGVLEMICTARP